MAGRAATALAVGWMGLCGGLALATVDGGIGHEQLAGWLSADAAGRSSVHYKNSTVPYAMIRPKIAGQIEREVAVPVTPPQAYWI
ncbi:MAG: hypothetical protein ABWZ27_10455 [Aestuariivirgaceae bacterium]|jgi:hypothetical protein